jgi:hypothetical protein
MDNTIQGLGLLKSSVKMVPVVGSNLEAVVDILIQSCEIAKVQCICFSHDTYLGRLNADAERDNKQRRLARLARTRIAVCCGSGATPAAD